MSHRFAVVYSRDYAKQYPESETAEYVEAGADLYWLCVDTTDGRVLGVDGGEPEDALLVRDWKWVTRELNAVNAERDDARAKIAAIVEAEAGLWATSAADGSYDAACRRWCDALDAVRDPANRGVALTSLPSRPDAREKLRALVEAASALCRDAANRGELKDEMRDSWDACFNAIAAARGAL